MAELQQLAQLLEASLDPRQNKQAEITLKQQEQTPNFSLLLLQIVLLQSYSYQTRLASALFFKNFIKRNWTDEEGNYKLSQDEVVAIKREIIALMISCPAGIQSQLGDAISVIADSDFWERWDTLVDDLVSKLSPNDPTTNVGVLQVAHSIFKRWRPLFRSDELYTEINHVLSKFAKPFLGLFETLDAFIDQNKDNKDALTPAFAQLSLMVKLFYDLSAHDLPPMFEDNLTGLSAILLKYLLYDNALLHTDDESEAGPLEYVKAGIFEGLVLYTQKYIDVFDAHIEQFVGSSWNLLTTIGLDTKYDILVSKALQFLTSVVSLSTHSEAFKDENTLSQVIEKVILPNISLRESDVELFEDEPIEFIRRDLEGSDSDTRRRAATDFLRRLMERFEAPVTTITLKYATHFLEQYTKSSGSDWKSKDTAVYLFSSIAAKGGATASHGVTTTNPMVDIGEFFRNNLSGDLAAESGVEPIIKVDAIKYLYTFRSIIKREEWQPVLPVVVKQLLSSNYVVYTYAAIVVERVLQLSDSQGPIIAPEAITPLASDLLAHLFKLIQQEPAPEKVQENEFLIKCVMRVLVIIKEAVLPFADTVLQNLIQITDIISANPSNPRFYYYHFEALGAFIRYVSPSQSQTLEGALYTPFIKVLQNDVQEFMPYVFQLYAALLEANPSGSLPDYYQSLIGPIISPTVWESRGNVPALVRLLSAIIPRGVDYITSEGKVEPILGIFQKLISSKVNESHAFDLLESVVEAFPPTTLEPYFIHIITLILTRLQSSATENLKLRFVRFYHFLSAQDTRGYGTDFFVTVTDRVQQDIFKQLYPPIILQETQKLAKPLDRKIAVISFTKAIAGSEAFATRFVVGWKKTAVALCKLLELPPLPATSDDISPDLDVDDMAFGVGFTMLGTIKKGSRDLWPEVSATKDGEKGWVGMYLKQADQSSGGRVTGFMRERLDEQERAVLGGYMGLN